MTFQSCSAAYIEKKASQDDGWSMVSGHPATPIAACYCCTAAACMLLARAVQVTDGLPIARISILRWSHTLPRSASDVGYFFASEFFALKEIQIG